MREQPPARPTGIVIARVPSVPALSLGSTGRVCRAGAQLQQQQLKHRLTLNTGSLPGATPAPPALPPTLGSQCPGAPPLLHQQSAAVALCSTPRPRSPLMVMSHPQPDLDGAQAGDSLSATMGTRRAPHRTPHTPSGSSPRALPRKSSTVTTTLQISQK